MSKRFWAVHIKRLLFALFVVFLIGFLYDYLTSDELYRDPLTAGLVAILVYLVASFLLFAINGIAGLLYLAMFGGQDMVDGVLDDLRGASLPAPSDWNPRNYSYLVELSADETANVEDRLKAATLCGAYGVLMNSRGIFHQLAVKKALDEAVLRYSQEAPRRVSN